MDVLTTAAEMTSHRSFGSCVLVPTMGALHEGHAALIRRGAALAAERSLPGGCVVTLFVNPTQFNDPKDLERYPRTFEADAALCRASGATALFAPRVEDVYPPDNSVAVPPLPRVATAPGLEDAKRPGHFAGVCQVVKRLFELTRPIASVFGEKDWQQLQVITALAADVARAPISPRSIDIVPHATIREDDGLALSSRNRFLTPSERTLAVKISAALARAARERTPALAEQTLQHALRAAGFEIEYAVARDAATLEAPRERRPVRLLVAVKLGAIRLIDNTAWAPA